MNTAAIPVVAPASPPRPVSTLLGPVGGRLAATMASAPLPALVGAVLDELVAAGRSFTAYDVTIILRALFPVPVRELPHYDMQGSSGVQSEVYRQMEDYLATGAYGSALAHPDGIHPARLYLPRRRQGRTVAATTGTTAAATGTIVPARTWVISSADSR